MDKEVADRLRWFAEQALRTRTNINPRLIIDILDRRRM